jgi:hypothetical protein
MNKDKIVSQLSDAIVKVLSNDKAGATKTVAGVLSALTATGTVSEPKATQPKATTRRAGPVPALRGMRLANFNQQVLDGTPVAQLARQFSISAPTAYRYAGLVRKATVNAPATEPTVVA